MFNAIFGNFLFSRSQPTAAEAAATVAEQAEAATQTSDHVTISTQTTINNSNNNEHEMAANQEVVKKPVEDWVIVDPNDEAERLNASMRSRETGSTQTDEQLVTNENLVDMQEDRVVVASPFDVKTEAEMKAFLGANYKKAAAIEEDLDIMLRSFFDRNEREGLEEMRHRQQEQEELEEEQCDSNEEEQMEANPVEQAEETWLITPLPCLTSITMSQRSIIENGTLENLLIEHPSMSVFMSATSQSSPALSACEEFENRMDHHKKNKPQGKKGKKSPTKATVNIETVKPTETQQTPVLKESQPKCVITKSVAEKRKEADKSGSDLANTSGGSNESLQLALNNKRKEKKNKKSPKASNNKENLQVKTLLLNDFKKCGNGVLGRLDCAQSNKNQMKRNNKNATFSKDANKKQRKYHNLQQPSFSYNSSNQQY